MPLRGELLISNEQIVRMVNEFKARPILWDPAHDLYRMHTVKYEAWLEIARIFECDVVDLRRKFNSIFASHRREKAKVQRGNKSRWFLYDMLSFLPSHVQNRSSAEGKASVASADANKQTEECFQVNDPDPDDNTDHSDDETEFVQEEIIIKNEPEEEPPPKRVFLQYRKPRVVRAVRPTFKRHFVTRERQRPRNEAYVTSPTKGKDECDSFGEYIAVSLRKYDERTRSMIKQAINNILFEQEMKKYSSPSFLTEKNPLTIGDSDDCEK